MGNPLPVENTEVVLYQNMAPLVRLTAGPDPEIEGSLAKSYRRHGAGWAVFYQLPGEFAYGIKVIFQGAVVYDEPAEVPKLTKTEFVEIHTEVFKLKLLFLDCNGDTLKRAYVELVHPALGRQILLTDSYGAIDFGYMAKGDISIKGVWWKGVWVKFLKAEAGAQKLELQPDGTLTLTSDRNYDSPVKLYANIFDIIFTPWDFNKDNRIPRLNITLTWVGVQPLTGKKLWFLETEDPTGDTDTQPFNTSVTVDQFLTYTIIYYQSEPEELDELKAYEKVEYVFTTDATNILQHNSNNSNRPEIRPRRRTNTWKQQVAWKNRLRSTIRDQDTIQQYKQATQRDNWTERIRKR